jgi:hypothetical protein
MIAPINRLFEIRWTGLGHHYYGNQYVSEITGDLPDMQFPAMITQFGTFRTENYVQGKYTFDIELHIYVEWDETATFGEAGYYVDRHHAWQYMTQQVNTFIAKCGSEGDGSNIKPHLFKVVGNSINYEPINYSQGDRLLGLNVSFQAEAFDYFNNLCTDA